MKRSTAHLEELLTKHKGPALLVDRRSRRIVAANQGAARVYAYSRTDLVGLPIESLWPAMPSALGRLAASRTLRISRHRRSDNRPVDVEWTVLAPGPRGNFVGLAVNEVSERGFTLALLESQGRVLERMARGAAIEAVLHSLVVAIEQLSGDMLGSVLLLSEDGWHVKHGVAPNLPPGYWSAIDGLKIGAAAGSCGNAMYSGKQVIVADIATDPLWRNYKKLALRHGLRACWSTPIVSPRGDVLGAFALYYREPREPGQHEQRLVQVAADLAAIAIGRRQAQTPEAASGVAHGKLSARERQVVRLIAQGEPVKRIAAGLRVSLSTVYTHRARIFEKLGVDSNVRLARYAVTHQLTH
jgi:DNA-binding CsgD family transcriptional regulator